MGKIIALGAGSFLAFEWASVSRFHNDILLLNHRQLDQIDEIDDISFVVNFMKNPDHDRCLVDKSNCLDIKLINKLRARNEVKLVLLSSRLVYGKDKFVNCAETDALNPNDFYGHNKLLIEDEAKNVLGNQVLILRLANIFGNEFYPGRKTFVGWFTEQLRINHCVCIDGRRDDIKDFLPVSRFSNLLDELIILNQSGIFNIGSGVELSLYDFASNMAIGANYKGDLYFQGCKFDSFVMNVSKLKSIINFDIGKNDILNASYRVGRCI